MKVPFFVPELGEPEIEAVRAVIESRWLTMGARVEEFEEQFAELLGTRYAVAVNSGTAALHLAVLCAGVEKGDEVIVPSLTFAATANAVSYAGARPTFADITGLEDWTIDPDQVEARIGPETKAVLVMHYGGYPCDMKALGEVCGRRGVPLIEDACHGLGGSLDSRSMGTWGSVGCFSFYSNKAITTGEGGMLTTDDAGIADRARRLRSHGMSATAIDRTRGAMAYEIAEVGFNYRLDDLRAALGLAQLNRLPDLIRKRRLLVNRYRERLGPIPNVVFPRHGRRGDPAHYILPVYLKGDFDRDAVRKQMRQSGIETSLHFPPVHRLPPYREPPVALPVTEEIASRALSLPLYPSLQIDQVDRVCEVLETTL